MSPDGRQNQWAATAHPAAPAQQYSPDQSQYVPPLESWPPKYQPSVIYVERCRSIVLPWIFVVLGLIIPISALITAIWAVPKARDGDSRYTVISIVGFVLFFFMCWLIWNQVQTESQEFRGNPEYPNGAPVAPPADPSAP